MSDKKFLRAASVVLMMVIAVTLVLAPGVWAANQYKVLHKFVRAKDELYPLAGLIFDAAGNLYGTTLGGVYRNYGTVFKLAPNQDGSWTESVLHSFNFSDGANPAAGLIFDAAGNLYGTTEQGGASNSGTVFKLTPNQDGSWTESVLHSFDSGDGRHPIAGLIFDAAGNLYGTTDSGGLSDNGTVFKLAPNHDGSWTESVLHSFNFSHGAGPRAGLIFDAAGNLYGTTDWGGAANSGTVFKLAPNQDGSWTESVLHKFHGSDGERPFAGLIFDAAGNLYGTTSVGGTHGYGTVFKLAPNQDGRWTESVLHSFNGSDGENPDAGLIFDAAGNLYGTTAVGGASNYGTVFKLAPNQDGSWAYRVVHVFQGTPAEGPTSGLVLGSAGTLYGTTENCAGGCGGVVYQIRP